MNYKRKMRQTLAPATRATFAIGRDTGTLFYVNQAGMFIVIAGRDCFRDAEGKFFTKAEVSRGRGVEYCFPGEVIEIEI